MNYRKETYETWQKASVIAIKFGIKTGEDYYLNYDRLDPLLPSQPAVFYKGTFPGWKIFLGTGFYKTWADSRDAAIKLGITSWKEYHEMRHKNSKLRSCPKNNYSDFICYEGAFDLSSNTNFLVDYLNKPLFDLTEVPVVLEKEEFELDFAMM